jgi:ABC-type antimicrobial peptide transport system permease subunit
MAGSGGGPPGPQVAGPTNFGEMVGVIAVFVLWPVVWITSGALLAAEFFPVILIALLLGGWTLLMRLRFDRDSIERTIGPFRQRVQLDELASIEFKQTGGWRSKGMLFVSDTGGHRVGIYVGRFSRAAEWSSLLLTAAETAHVSVQPRAHGILQRSIANGDQYTNRR